MCMGERGQRTTPHNATDKFVCQRLFVVWLAFCLFLFVSLLITLHCYLLLLSMVTILSAIVKIRKANDTIETYKHSICLFSFHIRFCLVHFFFLLLNHWKNSNWNMQNIMTVALHPPSPKAHQKGFFFLLLFFFFKGQYTTEIGQTTDKKKKKKSKPV